MKIKVFYPNDEGKIVLSKEELESLIKEAYNEGLSDGQSWPYQYYYYTTKELRPEDIVKFDQQQQAISYHKYQEKTTTADDYLTKFDQYATTSYNPNSDYEVKITI